MLCCKIALNGFSSEINQIIHEWGLYYCWNGWLYAIVHFFFLPPVSVVSCLFWCGIQIALHLWIKNWFMSHVLWFYLNNTKLDINTTWNKWDFCDWGGYLSIFTYKKCALIKVAHTAQGPGLPKRKNHTCLLIFLLHKVPRSTFMSQIWFERMAPERLLQPLCRGWIYILCCLKHWFTQMKDW